MISPIHHQGTQTWPQSNSNSKRMSMRDLSLENPQNQVQFSLYITDLITLQYNQNMNCQNKKRLWKEIMLHRFEESPHSLFQAFGKESNSLINKTHVSNSPGIPCLKDDPDQEQSIAPKFYIPSSSDDLVDLRELEDLDLVEMKKGSSENFTLKNELVCSLRSSEKLAEGSPRKKIPLVIQSLMSFGFDRVPKTENELKDAGKKLQQYANQLKGIIAYFIEEMNMYRVVFGELLAKKEDFAILMKKCSTEISLFNKEIQKLKEQIKEKDKLLLAKDQELIKEIAMKENYLKLLNKQWGKNLELEELIHQIGENKKFEAKESKEVTGKSRLKTTMASIHQKLQKFDQSTSPRFLEIPKHFFKASSEENEDKIKNTMMSNYQSSNSDRFSREKQVTNSYSSSQGNSRSPAAHSQKENQIKKDIKGNVNTPLMRKTFEPSFLNSVKTNKTQYIPSKYRKYSVHDSIGDSVQIQREGDKEQKFKNMSIRLQKMNDELKEEIARCSGNFSK